MLWIAVPVLVLIIIALGVMLKQSREALEAKSAELASAQRRAKQELEDLKAEHDKTVDRHRRHADQRLEGAHLPLAKDLFEGLDALEMAIQNAENHPNTTKDDLVDGIKMVHGSFKRALAKHDVTPIAPTVREDAFDPALHEAIGVIEDDDVPTNTVGELLRTGWHHPSKTLRPAMVQTTKVTTPALDEDEPTTLDFSSPEAEEQEVGEAVEVAQHS